MNVSLSPYDGSMILKKDVMKRFQASFVSASLVEAHFWAAAAVECHGPRGYLCLRQMVVDLRQKDRDVYDWQVKCELPYASVDDTSN